MESHKEIVILSGKGGCGKTSLTASFAALAKDAVIADCDVDAADLHLVLPPTSTNDEDFYSGHVARIDPEGCTNCGRCLELCRFEAIQHQDNRYTVRDLSCEGCGVCHDQCPANAIAMEERHCGSLSVSQTHFHPLVHAVLGPGGENSGKLVTAVRERARAVASELERDLILVDGPPGIGCPVIASLSGVWRCLVVTEPTISGKHDLERILKLTKHFEIETFVVVNKADINLELTQEIESLTTERKIHFLGTLPYDRTVTKAQREAKPVIDYECPIASQIRNLWERLQAL